MARKKKNRSKPQQVAPQVERSESDIGQPELRRHFPVVSDNATEAGRIVRRVKVLNHPVLVYFNREEITLDQMRAAIWIMGDYELTHQHRTIWSSMKVALGYGVDVVQDFDNPHVARERWLRAIKSLSDISRVFVQQVCIEGRFVKEVRRSFNWNVKNNGMDRFRESLDELYRFYVDDRKAADEYARKKEEERSVELNL